MDDAAAAQGHKISLVVGVLGLVVALVFDAIALIPLAADAEEAPAGVAFFISWISNLAPGALVAQGVAMAIRAIPIVQELPGLWTAAWVITWWIDSHPSKLGAAIQKGAAVASTVEGGGEGAPSETEGVAAGTAKEGAITKPGAGIEEMEGVEAKAPAASVKGKKGGAEEASGEGGGGGEEEEKGKEEGEGGIRMGAEVPPMEQVEEKLINPPETQFQEAPAIEAGNPNKAEVGEGEEGGKPAPKETEAERKAREEAERRERNEKRVIRFHPKEEERQEGGAREEDEGPAEMRKAA